MRALIILSLLFLSSLSLAQSAPSADQAELRARDVGRALRCVVCQNQSIEESEAALAKDMRLIVRERIFAGETDAEVIDFMRERYGDYVLLKPPLQHNTYLLWFLPALIVLGMIIWLMTAARRRHDVDDTSQPLSAEEQKTLNRLLDDVP